MSYPESTLLFKSWQQYTVYFHVLPKVNISRLDNHKHENHYCWLTCSYNLTLHARIIHSHRYCLPCAQIQSCSFKSVSALLNVDLRLKCVLCSLKPFVINTLPHKRQQVLVMYLIVNSLYRIYLFLADTAHNLVARI